MAEEDKPAEAAPAEKKGGFDWKGLASGTGAAISKGVHATVDAGKNVNEKYHVGEKVTDGAKKSAEWTKDKVHPHKDGEKPADATEEKPAE
ncbi:MAG: hypothetical protein EZS28_012945 [Streblomastix strix]|uniref:Uncharacterized protein n=1 Tax=Streblomastix strix TaxID=222440 RepID=A0A5J4W9H7_9EUKA|nr:MAG: hypothetical protein EZS28_012945 [Streblomastix strix]